MHIHITHLFQVELEKDDWEQIDMPKTLDYATIKLYPHYSAPYDHNARPSQTDGRTDR